MIQIEKESFIDEFGRTLILRGVNLGGSTKVPASPNGATYLREHFFDHRNVSFVARPFPLEEADEHFSRLRSWGFTFLRFLVTWEAIEHSGPDIYDKDYLDYVYQIIYKANQYGINLFIDPHMDVWSRFSGGDGAPGWTFEAVGMDITHFAETGAAIVHATHGDPFPKMIWPTNGHKLAAGSMYTLFFAGDDFAPLTLVDGVPVQEYLQGHYIAAIRHLAHKLKDLPNIIGFDTLNEPLHGYIGLKNLHEFSGRPKLGESPSPFQSMLLGAGIPQDVGVFSLGLFGNRKIRTHHMNSNRVKAWKDGFDCIWRKNGVWNIGPDGVGRLLRPDYFSQVNGRPVDFNEQYYRPFARRFAAEIRAEMPQAAIFIETEPGHHPPQWGPTDPDRIVYAPHWYDVFVLILKEFTPWIGAEFGSGKIVLGPLNVRRSFLEQLALYRKEAREWLSGAPVVIGEMGIAFDMSNKKAFTSGNFYAQVQAMNRSLQALEENMLSATLWNYTSDNTNLRGDQWNDEDLSIFSRDQQENPQDINSGGRALQAVVRPYAIATAGQPLRMSFDIHKKIFAFAFRHNPRVTAPTEIFIPTYHYPQGCQVEAPDGRFTIDSTRQILTYTPATSGGTHTLRIRPA